MAKDVTAARAMIMTLGSEAVKGKPPGELGKDVWSYLATTTFKSPDALALQDAAKLLLLVINYTIPAGRARQRRTMNKCPKFIVPRSHLHLRQVKVSFIVALCAASITTHIFHTHKENNDMYQKLVIVGNLGKDPEMRYAPNGDAVTNLSVATNRKYTDKSGQSSKRRPGSACRSGANRPKRATSI